MLWVWVAKAEHYLQRVMPGRSPGQNLTPSRQMGNSPLGLQTQIMSPFPWGRPAHIHPGQGWHKRAAADGASCTCEASDCGFARRVRAWAQHFGPEATVMGLLRAFSPTPCTI